MMTGFQLRLLLAALMVADHVWHFLQPLHPPVLLTWLGRLVAPGFLLLAVDGYRRSRRPDAFLLRLLAAAAAMVAGNLLVGHLLPRTDIPLEPLLPNIFFTLALCLLLLRVRDRLQAAPDMRWALAFPVVLWTGLFHSEGGWFLLPLALIADSLRGRPWEGFLAYAALTAGVYLLTGPWDPASAVGHQWLMIFAWPLWMLYDGRRGRDARRWFYAFYPLHIWALYALGWWLLPAR